MSFQDHEIEAMNNKVHEATDYILSEIDGNHNIVIGPSLLDVEREVGSREWYFVVAYSFNGDFKVVDINSKSKDKTKIMREFLMVNLVDRAKEPPVIHDVSGGTSSEANEYAAKLVHTIWPGERSAKILENIQQGRKRQMN